MGIIGGSGLSQASFVQGSKPRAIDTEFGKAEVYCSAEEGIAFVPRHGTGHALPPHKVNYRANIRALEKIGVQQIIATSAVGSLRRDISPGDLLLLDQFLDFTSSRPQTLRPDDVVHTDVTYPYCHRLRSRIRQSCSHLGIDIHPTGCYVCVDGPRYETAAEVRMFAQLGGDVVGMTGVPEAVLAREAGLCYASIAIVSNYAAGLCPEQLRHEDVVMTVRSRLEILIKTIQATADSLRSQSSSSMLEMESCSTTVEFCPCCRT